MPEPSPLFRSEALERSAVTSVAGARVRLVRPGEAVALAALGFVVFLASLWLVFGKVAVRVDGAGILLRPRPTVAGADPDFSLALLATLDEPALVQQRDQLADRLAAALRRNDRSDASWAQELAIQRESLDRQAADLDERLTALDGLLRAQESTARRVATARRTQLRAQELTAAALVESREAEALATESLVRSGAARPADLVDARAEVMSARQALDAVRLALEALPLDDVDDARTRDELALRTSQARAERAAVARRRLELERQDQERRGAAEDATATLRNQLDAVSLALERQRVSAGADAPEAEPAPDDGLVVVVFMDAADAKRVEPGMEIRVSLDSVERARYGSLVGRVTEVSERPIAPAQADALLSNASLADTLAGGGRAVLLVAHLDADPATPSGYRWTTSLGPPTPPSAGTTLEASVIVERRRPITWLLPALRTLLGVEG